LGVGAVELARPAWPIEFVIYRGGLGSGPRVVGHREAREDGHPILVVEEV
jgi:hypothetical protein